MKRDPYEVMGVDRKATAAQIKTAYRNLAKQLHPDVEGDKGKMQELNEAYEILSDPHKRTHYDETGWTNGPPIFSPAEAKMMSLVNLAVSDVCKGMGGTVKDRVRASLDGAESNILGALDQMKHFLANLERLSKKVKYRGEGKNLIAGHMEALRRNISETEPQMKAELETIREAKQLLDEYEFTEQNHTHVLRVGFTYTGIHG